MVTEVAASRSDQGWRERKRQQTQSRIAEAGMRLFMEQGFEATTLDAIAEAAGIGRRTFFHYFDSKEALLFSYEDAAEKSFRAALAALSEETPPFEAMCTALLAMVSSFGTDEARAIDKLLQSTEALRARKQGSYARQEQFLFAALQGKWPDPAKRLQLRMVSMIGMGVMRVAAEAWSTESVLRPLQAYLDERFAILRHLLGRILWQPCWPNGAVASRLVFVVRNS